jgi:hypothetical protein
MERACRPDSRRHARCSDRRRVLMVLAVSLGATWVSYSLRFAVRRPAAAGEPAGLHPGGDPPRVRARAWRTDLRARRSGVAPSALRLDVATGRGLRCSLARRRTPRARGRTNMRSSKGSFRRGGSLVHSVARADVSAASVACGHPSVAGIVASTPSRWTARSIRPGAESSVVERVIRSHRARSFEAQRWCWSPAGLARAGCRPAAVR